MDEKSLTTLEYPKILEQLAGYASFSASADLGRRLKPTDDYENALDRLATTTEARNLLSINPDISLGGVHDIRPQVILASRGGVLDPRDLLDVRDTLVSARRLFRTFSSPSNIVLTAKKKVKPGKKENEGDSKDDDLSPVSKYPHLAEIASVLVPPTGLIDAVNQTISDSGEVLDEASPKLGSIRRELKITHDRLLTKMERLINSPAIAPMLQEAIITQRNGRYVIPLRSEFKGRMRAMVHDQSSSGATLFVEPLALVEMNNRWHELQLAERDEERRILAELSGQVGGHAGELVQIVEGLTELDLALMSARYAEDLHASEPVLLPPGRANENHPGSVIRLIQARHPLLNIDTAVPIDIDPDDQTFAIIITGPNTGGKTVTLKTLGLLALMAQSGLHIPARSGSEISLFRDIFADIGDEQSIEQSLSTFSGHIQNIIHILNNANTTSLVLLDELGAGTDPQEGAALAQAILAALVKKLITCLVATHYPELKIYAHNTPGVTNACMEFDVHTLRPTYHLTIGLPGRSNALLIAERMGLGGEIIDDARGTLDPGGVRADFMLDDIRRQKNKAHRARQDAEMSNKESEQLRKELSRRLEKIEDERTAILAEAQSQAETELAKLQTELSELRRSLGRKEQISTEGNDSIKAAEEFLQELQAEMEVIPARKKRQPRSAVKRSWKVGNRVFLKKLNQEGVLAAIEGEEVEVQFGNLRMRALLEDIRHPDEEEPGGVTSSNSQSKLNHGNPKSSSTFSIQHPSPGMELDLRGMLGDEAAEKVETYLENAYLAGMPFVRIIHGKGTGKLREVVKQVITRFPHKKSWEAGGEKEGGMGVTVVHLEKD